MHRWFSLSSVLFSAKAIPEIRKGLSTLAAKPPNPDCTKWIALGYNDFIHLSPGKYAPDFIATDSQGGQIESKKLRGKIAILFFWASWCGACRTDYEDLRLLQSQYADRLQIIGVSGDIDRLNYEAALRKEQFPWPNIFDGNDFDGPIAKKYYLHQYPTIIVLDSNGRILSRFARHKPLIELIKGVM